ncbi:VWA domain-containing protein [Bacteroidota bacterium]
MSKLFGIFALMLLLFNSLAFVSASEESIVTKYITEAVNTKVICNSQELENCVYPEPVPFTPKIDVVFLIDSTGSMNDEIRSVKTHIVNIVEEVEEGYPKPDLRVGVVTYRDHEEEEREYLLKSFDLTDDVYDALKFIKGIEAQGGGDYPEAVADGLHVAVEEMNWNKKAIKIIFLVGDAPPHGEGSSEHTYVQGCPEGHDYRDSIEEAIEKDIRIYTVSGSGMDSVGVRIWKEIAEETGGEYEPLVYLRKDVDQYYEEEGIDPEFAAEAKSDSDYDRKTNSILTNTFGVFAKSAVMDEAMSAGVRYEEPDKKIIDDGGVEPKIIDDGGIEVDEDDKKIITYEEIITGHVVKETETKETKTESGLASFFRRAFARLAFW